MIRWCLVTLVLLSSCTLRRPQAPERLYERARLEVRRANLDAAWQQAERGFRQWRGEPDSLWYCQFQLLQAEILLMRGKAKDAQRLLEASIPNRPEFRELVARRRLHEGRAAFLLSRYGESKKLLDEALQLALAVSSPTLIAEVELRRGSTLARLGDFVAAEASFRNTIQIGMRLADPYLQAAGLINLGFGLMNQLRYDEAVPLFEQALPASEKIGNRGFIATALGDLGRCYYSLGDLAQALKLLSRAEAMDAQIGNLRNRQIWLGGIGNIYYSQRDFRTAVSYYERALALARELGEPYSTVEWLDYLSWVCVDAGDLASAESYSSEALALGHRIDNPNSRIWPWLNAARIAAAKKQLDQAKRFYSDVIGLASQLDLTEALWQAQAGLASVFVVGQQWPKADQQFQLALSTIENTRVRLARVEWKFTFLAQLIRFYQDYVDFLMERGQSSRALEVAESARALVLAEKLGLKQVPQGKASSSQFQKQARMLNVALLSFWLAPRRSFLWVITPQTVDCFVLPAETEIRPLVEAYTNVVLQGRDPIETLNATGARLFETLVAPARKLVRPGAKVIVVPDGSLHELNFETLLVSGEPPRYWIEEATIAVAPSLAVLQPTSSRSGKGKRLLLLGSPVSPGPEYSPLPGSEQEVGNIQNLFGAGERTILTGAQAHPSAYKEAGPERFALIHFSAHAVANRESPLDSAVILSQKGDSYKLYARDVAALPLRAELVTISACRSAGARTYSGEGLVGFTWAFLQAGAHNVIAGLWDVNDRSTSELMANLYSGLANGLGSAEALRAAKLALLRSSGPYRKPYYWAPFQVFTRSMPFQDRPRYAARRS